MEPIRRRLLITSLADGSRGLEAGEDFETGDLIERTPVSVIPPEEYVLLKKADRLQPLRARTFTWYDPSEGQIDCDLSKIVGAVAHGLMTFCNHCETPNAHVERDLESRVIELIASRPIQVGEEITIRYKTPEIRQIPDWHWTPPATSQRTQRP